MNNVQLIIKYSTEAWDKVYKKKSIASVFDGEKELLRFSGTRTVKIAKYSSDGLGDYQRANTPVAGPYAAFDAATAQGQGYGYPTGDVSLEWEEFTLRMDRARQLRIALFDNEESGEVAVTATMQDFSRTKVVPETDAYTFSELARLAAWKSSSVISLVAGQVGYNPNGAFQALNDAYTTLEDKGEVPTEDQVVLASYEFINKLRSSGEVVKVLKQNEYGENVDFSVYEYMGREIIGVPGRRFRTNFVKTANGFTWGAGSENIDFIVAAKSAVYHVVKYDKVRVFEPNIVQDFDGYKVNVRIYYDVFVPDNKRVGIYVHTSSGTAPAASVNFLYNAENDFLGNVAIIPGDLMTDGLYAVADAAPAIGEALPGGAIAVASNAKTGLTAGTYYLCATRNGVVVANNTVDTIVIA